MCSIESVRHSSHSTANNKLTNRRISFKMIEKRLIHLRQELRNLTKKEISLATNNEHSIDDNDNYHVQYRNRLNQLLRSHDKQVWRIFLKK
jgi:hypothetical protein